jgi:transcriptional regulator with XRE-family HTH domain
MNKETKNLLKNLNRRIAELRIEAGLTQEQLAEKMGVPLRALQYWEADRIISLPYLIKMAQTLRRDPEDFFKTPKVKQVKKGRPTKKIANGSSKNHPHKKGKTPPHRT